MQIVKRIRKKKKTYKYIKVYFTFGFSEYCYEKKEDYFTKQKTDTWKLKKYIKRSYSELHKKKQYVYSEYQKLTIDNKTKELFFAELKEYNFRLREKKLKRILKRRF